MVGLVPGGMLVDAQAGGLVRAARGCAFSLRDNPLLFRYLRVS